MVLVPRLRFTILLVKQLMFLRPQELVERAGYSFVSAQCT